MRKLRNKKLDGDRQCDHDDDHDGDELVLSGPIKRQKLVNGIITSGTNLFLLPTKLCQWVLHKFPPSSSLATSSASSSQELVPYNNSNVARPDHVVQANKYDVFISFRGVDVRNSFLSHLYSHLNDFKKFAVYKEDVNLERGEQISPALLQAIERSEVYVVILSPNYAESLWCLGELEKILDCKEQYERRIIPVFYDVDPSDVENQKLPSSTSGEIRSWRAALKEIANISGFDSRVIRPETKLIEEIAKALFQAIRCSRNQMVKFSSYSASRGLVGVERKIEQVEALLCLGDTSNRTIGLWGMAGIGKTTLAKAFIDLFSCQFEAFYVFSNFADTIASGLCLQPFGNLQSDFFSKLLGDDRVGGTLSYDLILHRLGRIKALVVIDDVGNDVGNIGPLKDLLNGQYCDLFGPGSVIIMTSRNKQLLKSVCHHVYEVKGLDYGEAFRLFCLHAFREESVRTEYFEMIWRAIRYVGGNPLAITVLGAHLFGRDLQFWYRELGALQDNPNPMVESVLRRSYDGLSHAERGVFLNLACFYDDIVIRRLETIEEMSSEGGRVNLITNLVDKSLISIVSFGADLYIEMNRLLIDLGRSIVNEERQIEKRSRLWRPEDVYYLFRENKGTRSIEGILHRGGGMFDSFTYIQADAFAKMENLRVIMIYDSGCNLILAEDGLKCLPNALRILKWRSFSSKYLPSRFSAENLVTLDLRYSKIEQLWECERNVDLGNLKFLNLLGCDSLRKLPNLSTAKKLEEIYLNECESLVELHTSILDRPKLERLELTKCSSLKLDSLEDYANRSREQRSHHSDFLSNLKKLLLSRTPVQKLPSFIMRLQILKVYANRTREQSSRHSDFLPNLKKLLLSRTPVQRLPNFIMCLQILELECLGCTKLTEFPIIPSLEVLTLTQSLINEVVELEKLTELKYLDLSNNKKLVLVSGDCFKLKSLTEMHLDGCSKLSRLPDNIGNLIHLESLDLSWTAVRELPSSIGDLIQLSKLLLKCCKSLASLPDTIHKLPKLDTLDLVGCDQLRHLPELPSPLRNLDGHGCKSLQTLSLGIVERHDFTDTQWCFAHCWKLDPVACSKLVDKFVQDSVRSFGRSSLLLPAKWGSGSGDEEGSTVRCNNSNSYSMATAKLCGQPWMSKSTIFCTLLKSPDPVIIKGYEFYVECVMLNNEDNTITVVSNCCWNPIREYEDQEERLSNGHFLVWSTSGPLVTGENAGDGSTLEFFFRGSYRTNGRSRTLNLTNCWVIPTYDERVVTNEDDEDEKDDDYDEFPNNLQGLYDQLCAHRQST